MNVVIGLDRSSAEYYEIMESFHAPSEERSKREIHRFDARSDFDRWRKLCALTTELEKHLKDTVFFESLISPTLSRKYHENL